MQLEFDAMDGSGPTHYNRKRIYALGSTLELNYNNTTTSGPTQTWALDTVRIYVPGPDGIIGAREFRPALAIPEKALVYHYDHLGSITVITDYGATAIANDYNATGGKPGKFSEDAWGQRRDPVSWNGAANSAVTDDGHADSLTPRGYTGHEMLDDLGLVHMNGRIYDPLLGRFLSADLMVQYPNNLQSYNRYSYVRNNPLTSLDSSGFWENTYATMTDAATSQFSKGNTFRALCIVVGQQAFQMASLGTFSKNSAVAGQVGTGQISVANGATQMAANTGVAATALTAAVVTGGASAALVGGSGLAAGAVGGAVAGFSQAAVQTGGDSAIAAVTGAPVPTMGQNAQQIAAGTVYGAVGGALIGGAAALDNRIASAAPQTGPAPEVNPSTSPTAEASETPSCFTAGTLITTADGFSPIETVRVGDRVLTGDDSNTTEVDQSTWRLVKFSLKGEGDDVFEIQRLYPANWIEKNGIKLGSRFPFAAPEMGIGGDAEVVDVKPCPAIVSAKGRVVLMTVTHFNPAVLQLTLAGMNKPLEPTAMHRLFSADRNDWVQAQELRVGDHLKTADGMVEVLAIAHKPGIHRVYNMEVETEHRYLVSKLQVVSHNSCAADSNVVSESSRRRALDAAQDHAQVPRESKGGEKIGWDDLNNKGENTARIRSEGGADRGRRDPQTGARFEDHPDGHPHLPGPAHHDSPHVHAVDANGKEIIVTYPSGT